MLQFWPTIIQTPGGLAGETSKDAKDVKGVKAEILRS